MKKFCALVICFILSAATFAAGKGDTASGTQDSKPSAVSLNDLNLTNRTETFVSQGSLVVSSEEPVSVGHNGAIKLVAGQSIILLPGTRISCGGFLYATIQSKKSKSSGKLTKLVTIEEKERIEEQKALEHAATLLSPFPSESVKGVSPCGDESNSISAASVHQSGITTGNNNKISAITETRAVIIQIFSNINYSAGFKLLSFVPEARFVLRL
jgi:hypothetical protein